LLGIMRQPRGEAECVLRRLGRGKAKDRSPVVWELRPMIEAEAPSTEEATLVHRGGARPPGIVMLAPPEVLRNAERAQSEGRAKVGAPTRPSEL